MGFWHIIGTPIRLVGKGEKKVGKDIVLGLIRHALTTGGGMLVAKGLLGSDEVSNAIGALLTLAGIGWSIFTKIGKEAK